MGPSYPGAVDMWLRMLMAGTAVAALLFTLGTAFLGPGGYWAWRLQKVLDQLKGLPDGDERFTAQRRVLTAEAERLSAKVSATICVPTPWRTYVPGLVIYWVVTILSWNVRPVLHGWADFSFIFVKLAILLFGGSALGWALAALAQTRASRREFIEQGMPESHRPPAYQPFPRFFPQAVKALFWRS